ncbi:hypothetical protein LINPERPRIM_LOCUS41019 [Linum perenne]
MHWVENLHQRPPWTTRQENHNHQNSPCKETNA